jgi:membrane-bound lytic murein transglycosylase B
MPYAIVVLGLLLALQTPEPSPAGPEARPSFAEWLDGVRIEALSRGIREEIVRNALADVQEPLPVVLERDRTQAETVLPLETYISRRLTPTTVRTGRQMLAKHAKVLEPIQAQYGVPSRLIIAIWGVESNFGRFSGVRPTVASLATLAWDPRRSALFRRELFSALEILNRGDIELASMQGSWAGAMGQPQFMPSSYLNFAQDFDGDGRRDIWNSQADIFASIANYLKGHGWTPGMRWGREVAVSREASERIATSVAPGTGSCQARRNMTGSLPLTDWQELGVRAAGGGALPRSDQNAALVSGSSRHFLVYPNYDVILEYNCAHAYAVSVALLSDAIGNN